MANAEVVERRPYKYFTDDEIAVASDQNLTVDQVVARLPGRTHEHIRSWRDRKSTRLNSSHT